MTVNELLAALGKRSPPSGKQPSVVSRGITQQRTHSPAGDFSHGFPAPRHLVGGPDHLVFLAEDKSVHSRQPPPADSEQLLAPKVRGAGVCLGAQMGTVFTVIAGRGPGDGVELKCKSAGEQRQNTKREVHHGFPEATAMPRSQGKSFSRFFSPRRSVDWEKPTPRSIRRWYANGRPNLRWARTPGGVHLS